MQAVLVRDLGEQGLLQKLHRFCPPDVVGDDAALITLAPDRALVISSDVLVDGVHFSIGLATPGLCTTSPADAGWRAAAANLSDLAAMGATPLSITVGLTLPGDIPVAWVEELYEGMMECLSQYEATIAGGDICRSPVLTVAIAALGQVDAQQAIRRSTAQVGDCIVVTGVHGASRAGLELLLNPIAGQSLSAIDRQALIRAHQRPMPRLDIVSVLHAIGAFQPPFGRVSGMDSSDGLADAILQLCRSSRVGARIARRSLPTPACFSEWLSPEVATEWTLYGGEDFELVLCLPQALAEAVCDRVKQARVIGTITPTADVVLHDEAGEQADEVLLLSRGFQHF